MKRLGIVVFVVLLLCAGATAQTTEFSYQGSLKDGVNQANGTYDFEFALFDALSGGTQLGSTLTRNGVVVTNGIFSVKLDFGSGFPGADRFLEIRVRLSGQPGLTTLTPRQVINSAPYSIKSRSAADSDLLGGLPASNFATAAQITALQSQVNQLQVQNTGLQNQITQLQSDLAATTGGDHLWSTSFGGSGTDQGTAVAIDGNGDIIITGWFSNIVNFGAQSSFLSAGSSDIFVAKYSGQTHAHLWSKAFGNTLADRGEDLKVDTNGDVYVTGSFSGAVNFGGFVRTSNGGTDVFLIKLSGSNGSTLWARNFGGPSDDVGYGVALDSAANPIITGYFQGTADFGTSLISAGGFDIFTAKYNGATNAFIFAKRFGGTGEDIAYDISASASGVFFVAGYFASPSITFGGTLTNAGGTDGYLAAFASFDGSNAFSRRLGGTGSDLALGVESDTDGNSFVTGYFGSPTLVLGGGTTLQNSGSPSSDSFIAKYDNTNANVWGKGVGGFSAEDRARRITLDNAGNPVITGNFSGTSSFGGPFFTSGNDDIFAAKYSGSNGAHIWSRRFGGGGFDFPTCISADAAGDLLMTGYFSSSSIDFGGGAISNFGSDDIFLLKMKK